MANNSKSVGKKNIGAASPKVPAEKSKAPTPPKPKTSKSK